MLRELIIFVLLSLRTSIQRIHTILIVFQLPSLAMYLYATSVQILNCVFSTSIKK